MPSPLDFLYRNNMGIQQMQKGGSPEDEKVKFRSDLLNELGLTMKDLMAIESMMPKGEMLVGYEDVFNQDDPKVQARQELAENLRIQTLSEFNRLQSESTIDGVRKSTNEAQEYIRSQPERSVMGDYSYPGGLQRTLGGLPMMEPITVTPSMQHGGPVFESAPADETAHDQMNNLIFENEMKQQSGASPLSFLNRDRIDSENQELMNAVINSVSPMMGATKIAPFNKKIFNMLGKMAKENRKADKAIRKSLGKIKRWKPTGGRIANKEYGETIYSNNLLKRAMKEYNEHRMVRPSTEINIKNLSRYLNK
jgi:hypothetical protein